MQDSKASRMFLVAAVGIGVLATVLAFTFINNAGEDRGPQTQIVVAARDLKPDTALDVERDLTVVSVPAKFSRLAALTLDPAGKAGYRGQRVNRRILAGQPVFLADLGGGTGDLELKEPYRALTITAVPGIVIPGDYVKVMVSRPVGGGGLPAPGAGAVPGGRGTYDASLVGKGAAYRVIAVGNSLSRTRQQVTAADQYQSGNSGSARTVTLAVTEDQAREILQAVGPGGAAVTLLLCPPAAAATEK